jgi:hypothetical protein
MTETEETFTFFVPMAKSVDASGETGSQKDSRRWIQGIASTDDKDLQDEIVHVSGIDTSYFVKYGYINDDHKPGPEHKVGEPTEARITKAGLWVKGFLYKGDGSERCDYWWNLMQTLERSGAKRKIGFSIEGKILRRAGKSILKCWLKDIAITACPVNTKTWAEIVKSLNTERWCVHPWRQLEKACKGCPGHGNCAVDEEKALSAGGMGRALIPQSLEGGMKVTTFKSLPEQLTYADAVQYLQSQKGYALATAKAVADTIFSKRI